eukprot:SAG31_NODE_1966_length_6786_cov_7.109167_3_plen_107_part_00
MQQLSTSSRFPESAYPDTGEKCTDIVDSCTKFSTWVPVPGYRTAGLPTTAEHLLTRKEKIVELKLVSLREGRRLLPPIEETGRRGISGRSPEALKFKLERRPSIIK